MSDFDQDLEQLDEFKASMGDPSSVPEPTSTTAKKRPGDKTGGETTNPKQGTSEVPGDPDVEEVPQEAPKTKMAMINAMVQQMNAMDKDVMMSKYNKMMNAMKMKEDLDEDEESIVISSKEPVKLTSSDLDISEDVAAMFEGQDLSEEFVEKASTIFEAAVLTKVNEQLEKITIDVEEEINEAKEAIAESLSEKLDGYLDYVVENWMEENKLAVEKGLQSEITSDFMEGLKALFHEHYIDIPDEKVDVAEELATKAEELEDALNEEINKNVELKKEIEEYRREEVLYTVSEDLSDTQRDKLRSLVESIDYVSEDSYTSKVLTIKEHYFPAEMVEETVASDEEPLELDEETSYTDPSMSVYVNAISRTKKK